jgi:L-arabinose isomerase
MHGVMDLTNTLWRAGRRYHVVAGHPGHPTFVERLKMAVRTAAGANVLRSGRVGRVGEPFEGMLDFTFDEANRQDVLGFEIVTVEAEKLVRDAEAVDGPRVAEYIEWARSEFDVDDGLSEEELTASARASLAYEDFVSSERLDAATMNFLSVAAAKAEAMPFLGAARAMSGGKGYAGEGDVLTAALVAAMARIAGEATFTEWFCPDYGRDEILLSHMGECNYAMARSDRPVRLVAKPFAWGDCKRPAVPVFQMKPGSATIVALTETPARSFKLIAVPVESEDAPEQPNMSSPYSRVRMGCSLPEFLERYSRAGGTHHAALAFGDRREEMRILANLLGVSCEVVGSGGDGSS